MCSSGVSILQCKHSSKKKKKKTHRQAHPVNALGRDEQRQDQVAEDPQQQQVRPEVPVRVIHRLFVFFLRLLKRRQRSLHRRLKLAIDIRLRFIQFLNEVGLSSVLLRLCRRQCIRLVGSLGTPRNVMPVAERVDHQNVDRGRHSEEVRPRTGQDVPRV